MKDLLVRSNENLKNIGIADTSSTHYTGAEIQHPRKSPHSRYSRLRYRLFCWGGHSCSGEVAMVLWNLLEICPLGCWGKVFMGRYRFGGTWIQNCLRRVLRKRKPLDVPGLPLLCRAWELGNLCTSGAGYWRSRVPAAVSLQHPLLTKLNIVPVGKENTLKGPRSVFTEQAKRMNLELRGNKFIISTVFLIF